MTRRDVDDGVTESRRSAALPRRRRWGRWLLAMLGLIAFGLVGWWLHWNWSANAALERFIADHRARGEPVSSDELLPPGVPDESNAVIPLERAFALLPAVRRGADDQERVRDRALALGLPLEPDERAVFDAYLAAHDGVWVPLAEAQQRGQIGWQIFLASPLVMTDLPGLNQSRQLANLLHAAAVRAHDDGNDRVTLERLEQITFLADAVGRQPFLVPYLVRTGIRALVSDGIAKVGPTLTVDDSDRERLRVLITWLLDTRREVELLEQALASERVQLTEELEKIGQQRLLWRPGYRHEIVIGAGQINAIAAAAHRPDWPAANAALPPRLPDRAFPYLPRMLTNILVPSLDRTVETHYRARAETSLAATVLAIRLYELDHRRLPESLERLVPDYLPAVPFDPLADGRTLVYRPAGDRPVIYNVGIDGRDDGGTPPGPLTEADYARGTRPPDTVVELRPRRRQWIPLEEDPPSAPDDPHQDAPAGPSTQ